jgi:hypothetical protein
MTYSSTIASGSNFLFQQVGVRAIPGRQVRVKLSKKVIIAASSGSAFLRLNFADSAGITGSHNVDLSFDVDSVDADYVDIEGLAAIPAGASTLDEVRIHTSSLVYASAGEAFYIDDLQVWFEGGSENQHPQTDRHGEVHGTAIGIENPAANYSAQAARLTYLGNTLTFGKKDSAGAETDLAIPGSISDIGGVISALGSANLSAVADADIARVSVEPSVFAGVEYTLVWKSLPSGDKGYRKYISPTGQLVETVNAVWDNVGNLWSKDVNGVEAFRYNLSHLGTSTREMNTGTNSWADSAWINPIQTLIIPTVAYSWLQLDPAGSSYSAAMENGWLRGSNPTLVAYAPVSPYLKPGDEIVSAEMYVDMAAGEWVGVDLNEMNHGDGSTGVAVSDTVLTAAGPGFTGVVDITNIDFNTSTNLLEVNKSYWIQAGTGSSVNSANAVYSSKITYRAG